VLDELPPGSVVLCVGAAVDFAAGTLPRAPQRWQRLGFEWLHRILQRPRLVTRYLGRDLLFAPLALREVVRARLARRRSGADST
jgi:N-acetylglucosaminyldiphosphoundecaprenol N-acetyl-beta-D-mannosaminyltransferase